MVNGRFTASSRMMRASTAASNRWQSSAKNTPSLRSGTARASTRRAGRLTTPAEVRRSCVSEFGAPMDGSMLHNEHLDLVLEAVQARLEDVMVLIGVDLDYDPAPLLLDDNGPHQQFDLRDGDQEHEQRMTRPFNQTLQHQPPPSSLILIDHETQTLTAPTGNPSGAVIRLHLEHDGSCVTILRDRNLSIIQQQDAELRPDPDA